MKKLPIAVLVILILSLPMINGKIAEKRINALAETEFEAGQFEVLSHAGGYWGSTSRYRFLINDMSGELSNEAIIVS